MTENETFPTILWRTLSAPGHETAKIYGDEGDGWTIDGVSIFLHEGEPVRLDYLIECDANWKTSYVTLNGWVGDEIVDVEIEVTGGLWVMNGEEVESVVGCIDIDLNFSPVTNTISIRRLDLKTGESETVRAAWLRFPSFQLELLEQTYTRIDDSTMKYETASGFSAALTVDTDGMITSYPDGWISELIDTTI